jgi:Leucine-rich repeat (LRR) protein
MDNQIAEEMIQEAKSSQKDSLCLAYMDLDELPESIGELTQLKDLILTGNHLTKLPESFGNLVNLRGLYLEHNHSVPNNQLIELPETVCQLKQLTVLSIANNQLKSLPPGIESLTELRSVFLDGNDFAMLPESIERLVKQTKNLLRCTESSVGFGISILNW